MEETTFDLHMHMFTHTHVHVPTCECTYLPQSLDSLAPGLQVISLEICFFF